MKLLPDHTSGPWAVHQGEDYISVSAVDKQGEPCRLICTIPYPNVADVANAKLIAAVPVMAEALKAVLRWHRPRPGDRGAADAHEALLNEAFHALHRAGLEE